MRLSQYVSIVSFAVCPSHVAGSRLQISDLFQRNRCLKQQHERYYISVHVRYWSNTRVPYSTM